MRTLYSVNYTDIGMMAMQTKWFDNLDDAKAFASGDYRDDVIVHNFKNPKKIEAILNRIAEDDWIDKNQF